MEIGIGIIGAADIARRRFLPALQKTNGLRYIGVASHSLDKAKKIQAEFKGKIYDHYEKILEDDEIGAVYIALPPALHYTWALKAVQAKKHIFVEKPFSLNLYEAENIIRVAKEMGVAVHENFMYRYHSQFASYFKLIQSGLLGTIKEYRVRFGFPRRQEDDFRYNKALGGGALLDCGCYTVDLARKILGNQAQIVSSQLFYEDTTSVDIFGMAVLSNGVDCTVSASFGMDNEYQCEVEAWGNNGILRAIRFFTAPSNISPEFELIEHGKYNVLEQKKDDQFLNSISWFKKCIGEKETRLANYDDIKQQASILEKLQIQAIKYPNNGEVY